MKVFELIAILKSMPQEAEVTHLWDGEERTSIEIVYEAQNGNIVTADTDMVCYSTSSRPKNAPTAKDDPFWATPTQRI